MKSFNCLRIFIFIEKLCCVCCLLCLPIVFLCVCACLAIFMLASTVLCGICIKLRPSAVIQSRHYNNNLFAFCICIAFMLASVSLSFHLVFASVCFSMLFYSFCFPPTSSRALLFFLIKIIWWLQFSWVALVANCWHCAVPSLLNLPTKGSFVYLYYISFTALNTFLIYTRTHFYILWTVKTGQHHLLLLLFSFSVRTVNAFHILIYPVYNFCMHTVSHCLKSALKSFWPLREFQNK